MDEDRKAGNGGWDGGWELWCNMLQYHMGPLQLHLRVPEMEAHVHLGVSFLRLHQGGSERQLTSGRQSAWLHPGLAVAVTGFWIPAGIWKMPLSLCLSNKYVNIFLKKRRRKLNSV